MTSTFTKLREVAERHNINPYIVGVSADKRVADSIKLYDKTFNLESGKDYFQVYDIDGKNIQLIQSFVDFLAQTGKNTESPELSEANAKLGFTSSLVDLVARAYLDNAQLFGRTSKGEETFDPKPHSEVQYWTFLLGEYVSSISDKKLRFDHMHDFSIVKPMEGSQSTAQLREGLENSNVLYREIIRSFPKAIGVLLPSDAKNTAKLYQQMPFEKMVTLVDHSDMGMVNPSLRQRIQRDYQLK